MAQSLEPTDTPFWIFSLMVYGREGVQAECLELQERFGLDVNLLLFSAYVGAVEGFVLSDRDVEELAEMVSFWHGEVVRELRGVRKVLKGLTLTHDLLSTPTEALRGQVKAAELQAEKIEQAMLWSWFQARLPRWLDGRRDDALSINVRAVLALYGAIDEASDPITVAPRLMRAAA